jgi:hypothetical protein
MERYPDPEWLVVGYLGELCKMPKAAVPTGNVFSPSAGREWPFPRIRMGYGLADLRIGFRQPRPGQDS